MTRNPTGFPPHPGYSPTLVAVCVAFLMFAIVGAISPTSLFVLLEHGSVALWVILAATGLGLCLVDALRLGTIETRWRLMSAAALGLGALSLLVLGFGTFGLLHRMLWNALLVAFAGVGAWRLCKKRSPCACIDDRIPLGRLSWLWLAAIIFGGLALLAATLAPGILWPAEGNGYDVLEYHLGAPREYFEAGRIGFLPHNIYSNFPFNVEMLYLLAMVLHGNAMLAGLTAQLLHVFLGMLAVAGIWLAGREMGRGAGIVAGVMAAVCPLVSYVAALAYVECGLLFFSAMALAAMMRSTRAEGAAALRWMIVSGLCAGFACGCKYTGVPATLLPLSMFVLWMSLRKPTRALSHPVAFVAAALAALAPWLIKNTVNTGNPLFPLARSVFHERPEVWDDDGAARWQEGHLPAPEDRPFPARLRRTWSEVLGSPIFGPVIGLAIVAQIARWLMRRRISPTKGPSETVCTVACYCMMLVGLAAWMGFTHLVDRFAIVLLIPSCVLFGCAFEVLRPVMRAWVFPVVVMAAAGLNLKTLLGTFAEAHVFELLAARGEYGSQWLTGGQWPHSAHIPQLNTLTVLGNKILMVGDAQRFYLDAGVDYCVVFNRNPFADAAASSTPAELIAWLRQQGYTHVYVDWGEMSRLRKSRYGFWKPIDVELFQRLEAQGLQLVDNFAIEEGRRPYATLFELPAFGKK